MHGAAADAAASKNRRYEDLSSTHMFVLVAIETLGPICEQSSDFLNKVGRRIFARSSDPRETSFLFQRISVAIQRINASCVRATLDVAPD